MFTLSHIVFRAWVALCLLLSFTATQDASAASSSKYDEIVNKGWKEIDMDQNHMYGIYNPEHAMSMDEAEVYLAGQFKQVYGKHKEYLRATGQEDTVSSVFMETNSTATKANAKGWYKGRPSLEELEEKESIEFLNRWEDARYQYHFGGSNPSSASSAFVEKSSRAGRTTARSKAGPGSDLDDEDSDSGDMGSVSGNTVSSSSSSDSKDSDVDSDVDSVSDGSVASSSSSDSIDSWQAEWKAQQDVVDTSGNMLDGLKGKEANVMFTHESSSTYLNRQKEAVAEIFKQPPSQVSTFVCSAFDVSLLPITGLPVVATFSLDGKFACVSADITAVPL